MIADQRSQEGASATAVAGDDPDARDEEVFDRIERLLADRAGATDYAQAVRDLLDKLTSALGEGWIGGPWEPRADNYRHATSALDQVRDDVGGELLEALKGWVRVLGSPKRILLLMYWWWKAFWLWDASFSYRSMPFLCEMTALVKKASDSQAGNDGLAEWETLAWDAICHSMSTIVADTKTFMHMNLSDANELAKSAADAARTVERANERYSLALNAFGRRPEGEDGELVWLGRRYLAELAYEAKIFYNVMAHGAETLVMFDTWLVDASESEVARQDHGSEVSRSIRTVTVTQAIRDRVDESLQLIRDSQEVRRGSILSECEPWGVLFDEIRYLLASSDNNSEHRRVFVPKRIWIRYCYPFAVQESEGSLLDQLASNPGLAAKKSPGGTPRNRLRARLQQEFEDLLGRSDWVYIGEPVDLRQTEFFEDIGQEQGLYGGDRVDLPDIEFTEGRLTGRGSADRQRCRVWLDLNWMGNLCLCVEPADPIESPLPNVIYRAFRAGTSFAFGEQVTLREPSRGAWAGMVRPTWDYLDSFARDVIRATADACYFPDRKDLGSKIDRKKSVVAPYTRGNMHLVAVVQTDGALGTQSADIARQLDSAIGGRILFRSIQRTATVPHEWLRFPPLQASDQDRRGSLVATVPEIGYSGDWFVHTGDTTVFGIASAPQWLRAVYPEVAQFASSWAPLLRQWNKKLNSAIEDLDPNRTTKTPAELRMVEQRVRRHLARINSEELTSTLANRRFLDELLEKAGVGRAEQEVGTLLKAAEQLTDWYDTVRQQKSALRRDIWLFVIALLGVFSLGDFMLLANESNFYGGRLFSFNLSRDGRWQDILILTLFGLLGLGGILYAFGAFGRIRRGMATVVHNMRRTRD